MATAAIALSFPSIRCKDDSIVPEIISEMRREVKRLAAPFGQALSISSCGSYPWELESDEKNNSTTTNNNNSSSSDTTSSNASISSSSSISSNSIISSTSGKKKTNKSRDKAKRMPRDKMIDRPRVPRSTNQRAASAVNDQKAEIEHVRKLWRAFRKKMRHDRQMALADEQRTSYEGSDALIQAIEQENEEWTHALVQEEPLIVVDSDDEPSRYELILPPGFKSSKEKSFEDHFVVQKEKHVWTPSGGLLDMFNMIVGKTWHINSKGHDDEETETVVTSDDTVSLSRSQSNESQMSWKSWNSARTEKVCNAAGTREFLADQFGGESDSPWLAAKRGDLDALMYRWKNRHDWTLPNDDGDVPLYLACRYGGSKNPKVVLFLLQQWPAGEHIPPSLMARCIADAVNVHVEKILIHPNLAEFIIKDYEEHVLEKQNSRGQPLDDIREEEDDDVELHSY